MPTYHARGVSIRLGVMPLADTITPNILLRKGDVVRKQCEDAERQLLNSDFLNEKRVTFPGDEHGYELSWLGGAPFTQSEVGRDLFQKDGQDQPELSKSATDPPRFLHPLAKIESYATSSNPLALSLHVITSRRTFVSGLDNSNKLHIKIEVFLNGKLSNCLFFPPYEYRSGAKDFHQVFGGHRVDFLAERPWVILPPNTAADGTEWTAAASSSVEHRWQEIGEALSIEADHRGSDKQSMIPPTAEFLKALAAMDIPDQVRDMQSPGSKKLAIIDVVITAGNGKKVTSGAAYLKAPQRFDDEKFPVRNTAESSKVADTTLHVHRSQAEDRDEAVSEMENGSLRTRGEISTDLERPSKRRAIVLNGPPGSSNHPNQQSSEPQNTSGTLHTLSSRSPSKGVPDKTRQPSMLNLPSTTTSSSRPFQAPNGHIGSPDRARAYQAEVAHQATGSLHGGSLYGTPQSLLSFPSSSKNHPHTPRTQLSPYSFQYVGSESGNQSPGAFLPSNAPQFPDLGSSPFHHMHSAASSPLSTMFPHSYSLGSDRVSEHELPGPAFPPSAFQQPPQRSSMGSSSMALSSPATPQVWPGDELYSQLTFRDQSANFVPNILPSMAPRSHIMGSPFHGLPMPSRFDRRYSMPLPPTGYFSVPIKPKTSMSPRKRALSAKGETSPRRLPARRLVITGEKGVKIVDHTWPITQHVFVQDQPRPATISRASTGSVGSTLAHDTAEIEEVSEIKPTQPACSVEDAPQDCDSAGQRAATVIHGDDTGSIREGGPACLHKDKGTVPETQQAVHEATLATHSISAPPEARLKTPGTSKPAPQRRSASNQGILGVQGPKATAFILEDPEQLLREAAKEKRTKAPRKPKSSTAAGSRLTNTASAAQLATMPTGPPAISSSPLSSIQSTPGLDGATDSHADPASPHTPHATIATPPPQLDGTSDRIATNTLSIKSAFPTKTSPIKTTPAQRKQSSIPVRTHTRHVEKQPRSPERLKTISNPPLNQDCVVALAESEDKNAKRGVLRQVRGERQGVFAEEYVVCATRFYVPGN